MRERENTHRLTSTVGPLTSPASYRLTSTVGSLR